MKCFLCLEEIESEINFFTFFKLNRNIFCKTCVRSNDFSLVHETFPTAQKSVCNLYYFEHYNPEIPDDVYLQFFAPIFSEKIKTATPIFFLLEYNISVDKVLKKVFKTNVIILSLRKVGTNDEY